MNTIMNWKIEKHIERYDEANDYKPVYDETSTDHVLVFDSQKVWCKNLVIKVTETIDPEVSATPYYMLTINNIIFPTPGQTLEVAKETAIIKAKEIVSDMLAGAKRLQELMDQ